MPWGTLWKGFGGWSHMSIWSVEKRSFFDHFETLSTEMFIAAKLLRELFVPGVSAEEVARQIKEHEHAADQSVHAVNNQLSTTFIHPIDREDILAFTKTLDDVIDDIHHAAQAFARIYELKETSSFAQHMADVILHECEKLATVCSLLRKPSRNLAEIAKICVEIHSLENEADDLYAQAKYLLYKQLEQEEIRVTGYLAWSEIYSVLERITDKAEDCANIAEQIAMKYS